MPEMLFLALVGWRGSFSLPYDAGRMGCRTHQTGGLSHANSFRTDKVHHLGMGKTPRSDADRRFGRILI